jgi:hypothetical protein
MLWDAKLDFSSEIPCKVTVGYTSAAEGDCLFLKAKEVVLKTIFEDDLSNNRYPELLETQAVSTTRRREDCDQVKPQLLFHIFQQRTWPTLTAKEVKDSTSAVVAQSNRHHQKCAGDEESYEINEQTYDQVLGRLCQNM